VRVLVLNGVNLNVLWRRDPDLYGGLSIAELESRIYDWGRELELTVQCRQTNSEAEFIKWIHDALEMLTIPIVEVHLSNIEEREEWRRTSVISDLVAARFIGQGPDGYRLALQYLKENS
jgi:3-dehydroquinate dehydratase-2